MPQLEYSDLTFIVDTREQRPWNFAPLSPKQIIRKGLAVADYSIVGYEEECLIERKSLEDFVGCCGMGRTRFEKELQKLREVPARLVIIEESWDVLELGMWRSQLRPSSVTGSVIGWMQWGIPFHFARTREDAMKFAARFMLMYARRKEKQEKPKQTLISEAQASVRNEGADCSFQ